jgi:hypothetical protein
MGLEMNAPYLNERPVLYVGIDGGNSGGIVGIDDDENIVLSKVMPLGIDGQYDYLALYTIFADLTMKYQLRVGLEKAHTMPLCSSKSNFVKGDQFGSTKAILAILFISHEIISAAHWQKEIFQGQTVKDTKDASVKFCLSKWPNHNWEKSEKSSKYADGKTDAAGLSLYIKRKRNS